MPWAEVSESHQGRWQGSTVGPDGGRGCAEVGSRQVWISTGVVDRAREQHPLRLPLLCAQISLAIVPLPLFLLSLPSFRLASFLACTINSHTLVFLPSVSFAASLCIFTTTFFSKSWSELSCGCSQISELVVSRCYTATSDSLSAVSAFHPSPAHSLGQTQPVFVSLPSPVLLQGPRLPSCLL